MSRSKRTDMDKAVEHLAQCWFPGQPTKQQLAVADIAALIHAERERAAKIVNDARSDGSVDLRELVSRIRGTNAD